MNNFMRDFAAPSEKMNFNISKEVRFRLYSDWLYQDYEEEKNARVGIRAGVTAPQVSVRTNGTGE